MKVQFSHEIVHIPVWKGNDKLPVEEQVKVTLVPMSVGDLLVVLDAVGVRQADGATEVKFDQIKRILTDVVHLLPKYVKIENLQDGNGPVTTESMIRYPYYMDLSSELIMKLAEISMPSEGAEKNFAQQPV